MRVCGEDRIGQAVGWRGSHKKSGCVGFPGRKQEVIYHFGCKGSEGECGRDLHGEKPRCKRYHKEIGGPVDWSNVGLNR